MEVDLLLQKKTELEKRLTSIIDVELRKFYSETGFSIESVRVTFMGAPGELTRARRVYAVAYVECNISF